ncbi:atos homolog protein B isoform X2 [Ambystoma mexicanum]|uniref:atos homolog protein B isoform X2 n=1 Tax=Ambystoma mexicanum TaxID=8296 RepID=UPI0037E8DEE5
MRHIQLETSPKEQGMDSPAAESSASSAGQGNALDSGQTQECRVLMGYSEQEIKRQKVYQVSIFSNLSNSSNPADQRVTGHQAVKRGCPDQRIPDVSRDPKRAHWGGTASPRRDGVPSKPNPDRDQVSSWSDFSPGVSDHSDTFEDGLLAQELPLCCSAQHFCHSGLRVIEHKCEGGSSHAKDLEFKPPAVRVFTKHASSHLGESQPSSQHSSCSALHIADQGESSGRPAPQGRLPTGPCLPEHVRDCGTAAGKKSQLFRSHPHSREPFMEDHASWRDSNFKEDGASSQNILDLDLHNIAQNYTKDSCVRHDEVTVGGVVGSTLARASLSRGMRNGSLPGKEELVSVDGVKEPTTPTSEGSKVQISESNGLTSLEKTPVLSKLPGFGPGGCTVKRKLLQSSEGAESCSEDESQSAKRRRIQFSHPLPVSCRSTDAKAAPFWNHLLPSARDSSKSTADCTYASRRLKSGLRSKSRHLRSLRKGVISRPPTGSWASSSVSRSLLGNFEESILKGRFAPSGRIEGFTAEIGASGSYCPQHATLPVEVTYFDISEHSVPSPFLGVIDLEALGKKGYSVPKAGTIQVTLFNPNKTVVKMFLVTYDFKDMPSNHVTFLRHRIFLVPVEEEEGSTEGHNGCSSTTAGTSTKEKSRRILCYLMHLREKASARRNGRRRQQVLTGHTDCQSHRHARSLYA